MLDAYDLILFDLDDTLLDFHGAQEFAFKNTLAAHAQKKSLDLNQLLDDFREINAALWRTYESGGISKNEVVRERFRRLAERYHIPADAGELNTEFLEHLSGSALPLPHALSVCENLASRKKLAIITNGVSQVQHRRITSARLDRWMSYVCVSDECGYAKPQAEIFHFTLDKISHQKALMVGDRLDVDVLGAHSAKVDSCWYNPNHKPNTTSVKPNFEIHCLSELR